MLRLVTWEVGMAMGKIHIKLSTLSVHSYHQWAIGKAFISGKHLG